MQRLGDVGQKHLEIVDLTRGPGAAGLEIADVGARDLNGAKRDRVVVR